MSTYALTDETAIDVLIFWIESTNGAISFTEQETVKSILSDMKYEMKTYHETVSHIGAMSTDHLKEVIEEAIVYVRSNFSDDGKKVTYSLLDSVARCDGPLTSDQKEKFDRLKKEFGF